jgi:hypothetical protein
METPIYEQFSDVRAFVCIEQSTSHHHRIEQIGAILYDVINNQEIATFERSLTSMPDGDQGVNEAVAALEALASFCTGRPVWSFDGEQSILEQICVAATVDFPFQAPFIHVKALLSNWGVNPADYVSGTIYAKLGIPQVKDTQKAVERARSLAALVDYFENNGVFRNEK